MRDDRQSLAAAFGCGAIDHFKPERILKTPRGTAGTRRTFPAWPSRHQDLQ